MPYIAKRRATTRKARRKRMFKRRGKRYTNVVRTPGPFAPRSIVKLKSYYSVGLSDTVMDYRFRLNSIYDLDLTGAGGQPSGHDQLQAIYGRYRVFKTKVTATVTTAEGTFAKCTFLANNDNTAFTNAQHAAELPGAITKVMTNQMPAKFKLSYYLLKVNGQTATQYKSDDRFQAEFGTNPSEDLCLHIVHSNAGGSAIGYTFAHLIFTQYVEVFDRKTLPQS